eukprot:6009-Heterococcus_DN1.PRE.1
MQTAKGLGRSFPVLQVPMLDELKFGVADSLTHAENVLYMAAHALQKPTQYQHILHCITQHFAHSTRCMYCALVGCCVRLPTLQFAEAYPEVAAEREQDKLNVRFPGGESYLDLFKRLE